MNALKRQALYKGFIMKPKHMYKFFNIYNTIHFRLTETPYFKKSDQFKRPKGFNAQTALR